MRRVVYIGMIAAAVLVAVAASAQAFTVEPVKVKGANETDPAAGVDPASGDQYVAWSENRPGQRGVYDAYLRRNTDTRIKLNQRGQAWTFGLDPVTHLASYQQVRNGNSDIRLYDYANGTRDRLTQLVNTPAWEYQPSISGPWLLYARLNYLAAPDVRTLVLYNRDTGERRVIDSFRGPYRKGVIENGQVNGDWVVWQKVTNGWRSWNVYRYQISTGERQLVPRPSGRYDYNPSVATDGTVYFGRSAAGCALRASLREYDTNGTLISLGRLPAGYDMAFHSFVAERSDGTRRLYYDSFRCAAQPRNNNIYATELPVAPPARGNAAATASSASAPWRPTWAGMGGSVRP